MRREPIKAGDGLAAISNVASVGATPLPAEHSGTSFIDARIRRALGPSRRPAQPLRHRLSTPTKRLPGVRRRSTVLPPVSDPPHPATNDFPDAGHDIQPYAAGRAREPNALGRDATPLARS